MVNVRQGNLPQLDIPVDIWLLPILLISLLEWLLLLLLLFKAIDIIYLVFAKLLAVWTEGIVGRFVHT